MAHDGKPAGRNPNDIGADLDEVSVRLKFLQVQLEEISARREAARSTAAPHRPPVAEREVDAGGRS